MEKNNSSVGGDEVLVDGEGFEVGGLGGKAHCAADSQLRCLIQTSFALFRCASNSSWSTSTTSKRGPVPSTSDPGNCILVICTR